MLPKLNEHPEILSSIPEHESESIIAGETSLSASLSVINRSLFINEATPRKPKQKHPWSIVHWSTISYLPNSLHATMALR